MVLQWGRQFNSWSRGLFAAGIRSLMTRAHNWTSGDSVKNRQHTQSVAMLRMLCHSHVT